MAARWYAICSKPHKEEVLWRQLHAYGFEVFYPRYLSRTGYLSAPKLKLYFPGYLFVKTYIEAVGISTFQWMPFATGLVCFGGKPAFVPDTLVEAIRKRIQQISAPAGVILEGLVQIVPPTKAQSSTTGLEIIFDAEIPGRERVRALLKFLDEMT